MLLNLRMKALNFHMFDLYPIIRFSKLSCIFKIQNKTISVFYQNGRERKQKE